MRLGRLRTADWHATRRRLFVEKGAVRLCDLASLEVSIPAELITSLSTKFGPSILLNEITESAGKWALSSSGQDGLIDKFMALTDQSDTVAQPDQESNSNDNTEQLHERVQATSPPPPATLPPTAAPITDRSLEYINTSLGRSLSKATLALEIAPLVSPAPDSAVVVDIDDAVDHPSPPPLPTTHSDHDTTDSESPAYYAPHDVDAQRAAASTSHSLTNLIMDRIPPARLIVELAALGTANDSHSSLPTMGGSTHSLTDADAWPQDPTLSADNSAEGGGDLTIHLKIPPELRRQSTSQSTLDGDNDPFSSHSTSSSSNPTTNTRLLLDLSTDAPVLTVPQIHSLLTTCFDATFHTRLTDHVTDPGNVELAARALRQLTPIVSLKHLSQVIHWMVARGMDRVGRNQEARPVELADVAAGGRDRMGLTLGPGWPVLAIAKLMMIVTFDWTPDVAGLFVGYVCQSWPVHIVTRLMAMMAQDEPASLASLFIKSATWPWSLMQVAELVSLMDCTLHWREAYFSAFTNHYLAHIERDLSYYADNSNHAMTDVPDITHGLPLRASPVSAFTAHAAPAAVVLARDKPTRILFLATLYRTSLAVQQFRLDAMLAGLSGVGVGALVEQAAVDVLGAVEEVRMMGDRDALSSASGSADGEVPGELGSQRVSLGSLARLVADAGLLDGSLSGSSASVRDEGGPVDRDVRQGPGGSE